MKPNMVDGRLEFDEHFAMKKEISCRKWTLIIIPMVMLTLLIPVEAG